MKTTLMDCPNCGYFIDVEKRNGKFKCQYCGSLLAYDLNKNKLTIEIPRNDHKQEKADKYIHHNKIVIMECPGCKANLEIDFENMIGFCPYCGKKLIYNPEGMSYLLTEKEKTKRVNINNDYKLERLKIEHKEKRKDALHDAIMSLLPFLGLVIIYAILYLTLKL